MKFVTIIFFLIFFKTSSGQDKIYFINETGRPVWVQKTNILGIGSFPYVLDTTASIQNIPIDGGTPTILNVVVIPPKGPYGTADGIDYLFKPDDTLIVKLTSKNQPLITHISSTERTKELSFIQSLMNFVRVTPFYTLIKTNPGLLSKNKSLKARDKLIDSLTRPYINTTESLSILEGISPEIGRFYKYHYYGRMITDKLLVGYNPDSNYQKQIKKYYSDSLVKWTEKMNCEDCQNIPFYNSALKETFKLRFGNLDETAFLRAVSALTHGYSKNFLLSSYIISRFEVSKDMKTLLAYYDSLCKDSLYTKMVHDNYLIHNNRSQLSKSELAILLKPDKSKIGFTQLISSLKGKTIYVDFWASWCKPCIEEIPFSHLLREKIKDSNIVMLYLSLDTDFNNWRESSKHLNINDKNSYILTEPETNKLTKKIKLGPIPRYIIIDKEGKIVRLDASRPSDAETYNTLLEIAKN